MNALCKEESASGIVVKLATIVTLYELYTAIEMSKHVAMKIVESYEYFRFQFEWKGP